MSHVKTALPATRFRRLRANAGIRSMVNETNLTPSDLIWPVFVIEGKGEKTPIASMPGVDRLSIDTLIKAAQDAYNLGVPAICIFPSIEPSLKTEGCEEAWNPDNLSNRAVRAVKDAVPDLIVMTDVALDPYNAFGHDGIVKGEEIVNDETVAALVRMSIEQARAGADILGPSDMMDGRIAAMRAALESDGFHNTAIMSYSAKYASAFYGPFRDAVGASGRLKGDKQTYQMQPGNSDEALRLVERDLMEGADMVMVKPGMPYLDICRRVKDRFGVPTFAYQVSGEYAMLMAAIENGWLDGDRVVFESLLAFKRAGCNGILTYFAPHIAKILNA